VQMKMDELGHGGSVLILGHAHSNWSLPTAMQLVIHSGAQDFIRTAGLPR
jgi:hypothetical protein